MTGLTPTNNLTEERLEHATLVRNVSEIPSSAHQAHQSPSTSCMLYNRGFFFTRNWAAPEGAVGEGVTAVGAVDQFQALADAAEDHGVFTDDIAGADGQERDLFFAAFPDQSFSAVDGCAWPRSRQSRNPPSGLKPLGVFLESIRR